MLKFKWKIWGFCRHTQLYMYVIILRRITIFMNGYKKMVDKVRALLKIDEWPKDKTGMMQI